jgi:hypothetical protein
MLELRCDICKDNLREPGGLIFSPPTTESWLVQKYHVCTECWPKVVTLFDKQLPDDEIPA